MMKAVMLSIRPEWCAKIANGKKTIELRKTKPKLKTPFKCYIYCTLEGSNELFRNTLGGDIAKWNREKWADKKGKVIGEFICDSVLSHCEMANADIAEAQSGVRREKILEYADNKEVFGWHISNLTMYDRPLEINQFVVEGDCDCMNCKRCFWFDGGNGYNVEGDCNLVYEYLGSGNSVKPLFRPPQSWCYVEEE